MGIYTKYSKLKFIAYLSLAFFLSATILPASTGHSEIPLLMTPQKGMCYVTWDRDRFSSQYSDASLEKLSGLGVEYLSLCVTQYQEKYNSIDIKATEKTPSDKSMKHVIRKSHELGLKIMLKPHVDLIDKLDGTYWRADIGFASEKDWGKWFSNYEKYILYYARMAQETGVEIFCVGTELSFTTQREAEWRKLIAEVKKIYDGKLVYAANWDNFKNVKFWDELDFAGIDAYFPLTYNNSPTLEDLKKGWEKWKYEIEAWQIRVNKPVLFTEIGYPSSQHAPYTPWKGGMGGNADIEIQAKCYEAFFQTVWNEPWFAGVYWWKWDTNTKAGGKYNRQFTPQNKPAQDIIAANYKKPGRDDSYTIAKVR